MSNCSEIMKIKNSKGQNLIEYALILGIIAVALFAMQTYFQRGIQSVIKVVADDYGPQATPIEDTEMAVKQEAYKGRNVLDLDSSSSWTQTTENLGEGSIHTDLEGQTTTSGESFSVSVIDH